MARAAEPTSTPAPAAPKSARPLFGARLFRIDPSNDTHPRPTARPDYVLYALWVVVAGLCLQRCLYHHRAQPSAADLLVRRALLAKRMHRVDEARTSLDRLLGFPELPADLKAATREARRSLK